MDADNTVPLQPASFKQQMTDAVAGYEAATVAADIDALRRLFAENCELVSPLSGRLVFRGRHDLAILAKVIYSQLHDLRWTDRWIGDTSAVIRAQSKIGRFPLDDLMVLEFDSDARIIRIRPHLRPLVGSLWLFAILLVRMAPHPGVIRRAFRGQILMDRS